MAEYISEKNEKTIRNLLVSCKKAVPDVVFKVMDTEELVIKSSDVDEILAAIDGGCLLYTYDSADDWRGGYR